jgi:hypothetical protein
MLPPPEILLTIGQQDTGDGLGLHVGALWMRALSHRVRGVGGVKLHL